MLKMIWRIIFNLLRILFLFGVFIILAPRLLTAILAISRLYEVNNAPQAGVAIVFGAGLWRDGSPTPVLRDRVATAVDLYNQGKIQTLLMSGDNRSETYNEPEAMKRYAISLGIPEAAIILDHAGRRTYDTCYRAKSVFGVDQAILVTQQFHLPRALYTCRAMGIQAVGVPADRREYRPFSLVFWNLRELPATLTALLDVHITRPLPVLGDPDPIFPIQSQY